MISKQMLIIINCTSRGRKPELSEGLGSELKKDPWQRRICKRRVPSEEKPCKVYHTGRGMHNNNVVMLASRLRGTPHAPSPSQRHAPMQLLPHLRPTLRQAHKLLLENQLQRARKVTPSGLTVKIPYLSCYYVQTD